MAKNDNLTDFLTDVANAIREKKGTNEPINPQNFSSEIASIQSGGGQDRLQWKCDNVKSLASEFDGYTGTDYSILDGLDMSKVETFSRMFYKNSNMTTLPNLDLSGVKNNYSDLYGMCIGCPKITNATLTLKVPTYLSYTFDNQSYNTNYPINITINNSNYITSLSSCFRYRRFRSINGGNTLDIPNCLNLQYAFENCYFYEMPSLKLTNTQNVTDWYAAFNNCQANLESLGDLDLISATSINNMFNRCSALKNLIIKNIKLNISFSSSSKLTNESLLIIAQELWDNTGNALGGARTLTMATASKTNIQSIYVKLITPTAEQEAEDPYINNKKPCVECESTDDGAMTLEEYILSKNWVIG